VWGEDKGRKTKVPCEEASGSHWITVRIGKQASGLILMHEDEDKGLF
jgi:hypothetical protein